MKTTKDLEKRLIDGNFKYLQKIKQGTEELNTPSKETKLPVLILTCMDPRIDVHRIFQLDLGDAFVLRNAGNTYTPDILRSILVSVLEYSVKQVVVLGHFDCGMKKFNLMEIKKKMKFDLSLKELNDFFKPILDEIHHVKEQIKILKSLPQFPSNVDFLGMIYDPATGIVFESNIIDNYNTTQEFKKNLSLLLEKKSQEQERRALAICDASSSQENKVTKQEKPMPHQSQIHLDSIRSMMRTDLFDRKQEKEQRKSEDFGQKSINNFKVPQITIPQIHLPKIQVHIPHLYKKKSEK